MNDLFLLFAIKWGIVLSLLLIGAAVGSAFNSTLGVVLAFAIFIIALIIATAVNIV